MGGAGLDNHDDALDLGPKRPGQDSNFKAHNYLMQFI